MGKVDPIERRLTKRKAWCRGCNKEMPIVTEIIYTYSSINRGQNILFCLDCAKEIGELANAETQDN